MLPVKLLRSQFANYPLMKRLNCYSFLFIISSIFKCDFANISFVKQQNEHCDKHKHRGKRIVHIFLGKLSVISHPLLIYPTDQCLILSLRSLWAGLVSWSARTEASIMVIRLVLLVGLCVAPSSPINNCWSHDVLCVKGVVENVVKDSSRWLRHNPEDSIKRLMNVVFTAAGSTFSNMNITGYEDCQVKTVITSRKKDDPPSIMKITIVFRWRSVTLSAEASQNGVTGKVIATTTNIGGKIEFKFDKSNPKDDKEPAMVWYNDRNTLDTKITSSQSLTNVGSPLSQLITFWKINLYGIQKDMINQIYGQVRDELEKKAK